MLSPNAGDTILDATVGAGGHSRLILEKLGAAGRLIALDRDRTMLGLAKERIGSDERVKWINGDFRNLDGIIGEAQLFEITGAIADLGWAADQFGKAERGFSFSDDGPLDMRLDPEEKTATASDLVNSMSEIELERIIREYGEERFARRIAKMIVSERRNARIESTGRLKDLILRATPPGKTRLHRATRTFQAFRIAVNDELGALEEFLAKLPAALAPGGRAVVISFHSLEDRLVKRSFRAGADAGYYELLIKKPLVPSESEIAGNPRARSAKLRAVRKVEVK